MWDISGKCIFVKISDISGIVFLVKFFMLTVRILLVKISNACSKEK